jgi:pSer/pThr/pTyr-binding forkhead associated (FHA) protein
LVIVLFQVLAGKNSGSVHSMARFPALIGRSATAQLRLEEPGVWDRHLQLDFSPTEGFSLSVLPGSWALLNGRNLEEAILRNGDVVELGSVKLQFWLSGTRQRDLRLRETLTWVALGLLCAGQIALIYRLMP